MFLPWVDPASPIDEESKVTGQPVNQKNSDPIWWLMRWLPCSGYSLIGPLTHYLDIQIYKFPFSVRNTITSCDIWLMLEIQRPCFTSLPLQLPQTLIVWKTCGLQLNYFWLFSVLPVLIINIHKRQLICLNDWVQLCFFTSIRNRMEMSILNRNNIRFCVDCIPKDKCQFLIYICKLSHNHFLKSNTFFFFLFFFRNIFMKIDLKLNLLNIFSFEVKHIF